MTVQEILPTERQRFITHFLLAYSELGQCLLGAAGIVWKTYNKMFNQLVTNGFSHPYQLDEFIFIFRGIRSVFQFLFQFLMRIVSANRIAPDGTLRFAASHLGLFCLPMSHKKDARLIYTNMLHWNSESLKNSKHKVIL